MNQLVVNTVILVFLCTFLQVFATYTSFATHDYGRARRPENGQSYNCQPRIRDPRTKICCFGRIYPKVHGFATRCCTNGVYNYYTMKCCRGNPIPKNHNCQDELTRYKCGNTYYTNPNAVICCNGNLHKRSYGASTRCCGQGFNAPAWRQKPAYGNRYGASSAGVYDYRVQTCCYGRVLKRGTPCQTCGGIPNPDPAAYICCNNKVLKRKPNGLYSNCCGNAVYNRLTQICCSGRVLQRSSTTRCCGSQVYDMKTHICCAQRAVKKRQHGIFSRCCSHGNRHTVYDYRSHMCCNRAVAPRAGISAAMCCGQHTYNSRVAKCCPGNRVVVKCGSCH